MKGKIILFILVAMMFSPLVYYFYCDNFSDEGSMRHPLESMKKMEIIVPGGKVRVTFNELYQGSELYNFKDFCNLQARDGMRIVVFEYTVKAIDGFEKESFIPGSRLSDNVRVIEPENYGDPVCFGIFDEGYETDDEYYNDYYKLELKNGEKGKMYEVMEIPEDIKVMTKSFKGMFRPYWIRFEL